MVDESKRTAPAAYLPFKTFLSSIEALEHGLPKKLDRSIWRGQSGIVQGQIMMAFRFLRLLDDQDQPTPGLKSLVEEKDRRPALVGMMLKAAYKSLFEKHDLTETTPKMLDDAMSAYGVQGDTRRKAVAFFLRAVRYAEIPMHMLLTAQMRNSSGSIRRKRKTSEYTPQPVMPVVPQGNPTSGQAVSKSVTLPSGTVVTLNIVANWMDMDTAERGFIFGLIDRLQGSGSKDDEEEDDQ